jgi:hypothetical protein
MSLAASIEPTQREFFDIHGDKAVEVPLAPNETIRTQHDKKYGKLENKKATISYQSFQRRI